MTCLHRVHYQFNLGSTLYNNQPARPFSHSSGCGCCPANRKVLLLVRRCCKNWIFLEEVDWLEIKTSRHGGHDREVLLARDVVESKRVPQHDVLVLDRSIPIWSMQQSNSLRVTSFNWSHPTVQKFYLSDQTAKLSSPSFWYTNSPPAHSSLLLYGVTQIWT